MVSVEYGGYERSYGLTEHSCPPARAQMKTERIVTPEETFHALSSSRSEPELTG